MNKKFFPTDLPELEWMEFQAEGFDQPVSGVIYRTEKPPCCGVPLGGIGTGCIDIDARGVYGFSSIFNPKSKFPLSSTAQMPRKLPRPEPILGLAVGGSTWVLASKEFIEGGTLPWCTDPLNCTVDEDKPQQDFVKCPKIEGVQAVKEIHYWGHYPVADMEFETDAPVIVSLRAWAPFIPGDTAASNIPAAIFEVHLCNTSNEPKKGTIAFNFPGPDTQEAMSSEFTRRNIKEDFVGVLICSTGGISYVLGVIGDEQVRLGAGLHTHSKAWSKISTELPKPSFREYAGNQIFQDSSASAAVDFSLDVGEEKIVRFILAWYAPLLEGASKTTGNISEKLKSPWLRSSWAGDTNYYTHMYASRYDSALEVARRMVLEHNTLLRRVLAWQEVIYSEQRYPIWLRDVLVNSLALITEDSYWVQAKHPLGDWAYPEGMFAMNESPRGCPHMACIPCDWMGTLPILYFFPELLRFMLKGFKQYQLDDGEIPLALGRMWALPDFVTLEYWWQVSLNGTCYVSLVDRLWQCTGDDAMLREFYDSVKRCNTFTMNLASGPEGVISIPDRGGSEWIEHAKWQGMVTHIGGLHLAQLRIMERMALHIGDTEYAEQCRRWFADGSKALEDNLWAGTYYLNYYDKKSGQKSDEVMAMQLDGHFLARHHGLEGVFRKDRLLKALETIQRCCIAPVSKVGALTWARPDASLIALGKDLTAYCQDNVFPTNNLFLAATYMYAGRKNIGMELACRIYENIVLRQRHPWDMPNILHGDSGARVYGTDYYQMLFVWALPVALENQDLTDPCKPKGFVARIIQAGENVK